MKKRKIGIWLLIALFLFSLVGCGQNKESVSKEEGSKKTIKIGYLPITHAVPLYIEEELKSSNLELVKFGSWPELMDALNTGKIDGASVLIELAMKAKEQGIDLKAVALGHKDGNVVVTSNDVHDVHDLKGDSFAIPHKFSTHNILLHQMLKQSGLEKNHVNVVELPPAEMPAALAEGRISGYIVAEPFGAQSVAINKGKALYQSEDLWIDSICCALILRNDFIKNNKTEAQEFINGYVKAGEIAEKKDQQTYDAAAKYMKVEKNVLDLSLQWITYDDLKIDEKSYEELRQNLIEMGISENPPAFEDFVDNSLIDQVS